MVVTNSYEVVITTPQLTRNYHSSYVGGASMDTIWHLLSSCFVDGEPVRDVPNFTMVNRSGMCQIMPMSTRRECSPSWVWSDSCGVTEVPRAHWPPNAFTLYIIFYNIIRLCPDRHWWPYKRSVAICIGLYVQLYMSISDQSLYAYRVICTSDRSLHV